MTLRDARWEKTWGCRRHPLGSGRYSCFFTGVYTVHVLKGHGVAIVFTRHMACLARGSK
jgi:hypothetical protein